MKTYIYTYILFLLLSLKLLGQCPINVETGTNLVKNFDFANGYTDWSHATDYTRFTPCGSCWSAPGRIYVGSNPVLFNSGFGTMNDHTPTADGQMLMVDGLCTPGIKLWSQSGIPVLPNTNYFFEVWVTRIINGSPNGTLQFDINGVNLPTTIDADQAVGTWEQFTTVWNSGPTPPATITISIENTTTTGCNSAVDFAIDDITFTPGCGFGSAGPTPDLGLDRSICGTGGSVTLNSNVTPASNVEIQWSDSPTIFTNSNYSKTITAPGTYSVCTRQGGSCWKSSVVNISGTFAVDLGPDVTLCNPVTATLDAAYSGPSVKYRWYRNFPTRAGGNDTARTYLVTSGATYRVDVIDPVCGTRSDNIIITSNAATPNDATYCATGTTVPLSVTGTGRYRWCSNATGTCTRLARGTSYTTPALTAPTSYTYYVEDTSTFSLNVGPSLIRNAAGRAIGAREASVPNNMNDPQPRDGTDTTNAGSQLLTQLIFNAYTSFRIDSLSVAIANYHCDASTSDKVVLRIRDRNNKNLPGSPVTFTRPCQFNSGGNLPAGIIRIPINITIPQGDGYSIEMVKSDGNNRNIFVFLNDNSSGSLPTTVRYKYPTMYNDISGDNVVEFVSNSRDFNLYYKATAYPGYFDWRITKGINCQRVPVRAIYQCPLPVDFVDFHILNEHHQVQINWKTENEKDNDYFAIERSIDGKNFQEIGRIDREGNHSRLQSFQFSDTNPIDGISYYRVKQVDHDGDITLTNLKSVSRNLDQLISIYPNPASDAAIVQVLTEASEKVSLRILNASGLDIETIDFETNMKKSFGEKLSSGLYFLEITSSTGKATYKFIKN